MTSQRVKDATDTAGELWIRARFKANEDDYRSVVWPPVGPYWCSGYGEDFSVVVAFVKSEEDIFRQWPEADEVEMYPDQPLTFSERFPQPDWWPL